MRLLHDFLARELLSREVHIGLSQSVPIVESLSFTVLVVHFGLEQNATH